jgi:hypothetical protein
MAMPDRLPRPHSDAAGVVGTGERQARHAAAALTERGVLVSESPRGLTAPLPGLLWIRGGCPGCFRGSLLEKGKGVIRPSGRPPLRP